MVDARHAQTTPPRSRPASEPASPDRPAPRPAPQSRQGAGTEFLAGTRLLGRGFSMYLRNPRLLLFGMIPAAITLLIMLSVLAVLVYVIGDIAALVTWFADDWPSGARTATRFAAGAGILLGTVLLTVVTFTALTLIIGDPFYESISKRIEDAAGGSPEDAELPWYRTIWHNLTDSVRLLVLSLCVSVPLFIGGFIPGIGQVVMPVIDVTVGGWLLAIELTGVAFNRRGLRLKDRYRLLRANRPLALGFGVPVFVMLLVPFAGVFVVPAAVAGATLLTRRVLGLPVATPTRGSPSTPGDSPGTQAVE